MSEPANQSQRARRRAHWVSLRTLQRVPNVVGETDVGEPIVEIGEARLVLPHGAHHFYHLNPCSLCGKETITDAVLSTAHLTFSRDLYCQDCARLPAALAPLHPDDRQEASDPAPAGEAPVPDDAPVPETTTSVAGEDDREPPRAPAAAEDPAAVAAATDQGDEAWEALLSQLEEAVADRLERSREELISELGTVVRANLDEERRAVASSVASALAERVDDNLRDLAAALTERFDEDVRTMSATFDRRLDQQGRALTALLDGSPGEHDLSTGFLDERLEKAVEQISSQVERAISEALEKQRRAIAEGLETERQAIAERFEKERLAIAERFEKERLAIDERLQAERQADVSDVTGAVRATLDRTVEDLSIRLRAAPAARLDDEQREALTEQVVTGLGQRLDEQRQALVSEITSGIGGRLDEQRKAVVSEITGGLGGRIAEDLRRLAATLGGRFGEAQEVLVAQLKEASRGRRRRKGAEAVPNGEPDADDAETMAPVVLDELYERLDRVAAGAAEAGMMSARALLRATEEHVVATSSSLAAHIADLQREVGDTRKAITDLRLVVDRLGRQVASERTAARAARKPAAPRKKPPPKQG